LTTASVRYHNLNIPANRNQLKYKGFGKFFFLDSSLLQRVIFNLHTGFVDVFWIKLGSAQKAKVIYIVSQGESASPLIFPPFTGFSPSFFH